MNAAHFVLATIYDVLGDFDRSIERYNTILETAPNDVRSLNNLAYALAVNKKMVKEALPYAQKAYSIAHDNEVSLTLDIGYAVAARKGTPPNVLPFAPVGYNIAAIKAQIADTLGWVHHLLGDDAAADPYLTQAAAGSPNSAEVLFHVAVVKAARSDFDTARKMLRAGARAGREACGPGRREGTAGETPEAVARRGRGRSSWSRPPDPVERLVTTRRALSAPPMLRRTSDSTTAPLQRFARLVLVAVFRVCKAQVIVINGILRVFLNARLE